MFQIPYVSLKDALFGKSFKDKLKLLYEIFDNDLDFPLAPGVDQFKELLPVINEMKPANSTSPDTKYEVNSDCNQDEESLNNDQMSYINEQFIKRGYEPIFNAKDFFRAMLNDFTMDFYKTTLFNLRNKKAKLSDDIELKGKHKFCEMAHLFYYLEELGWFAQKDTIDYKHLGFYNLIYREFIKLQKKGLMCRNNENDKNSDNNDNKCPFASITKMRCVDIVSIFNIWYQTRRSTKMAVQDMLDAFDQVEETWKIMRKIPSLINTPYKFVKTIPERKRNELKTINMIDNIAKKYYTHAWHEGCAYKKLFFGEGADFVSIPTCPSKLGNIDLGFISDHNKLMLRIDQIFCLDCAMEIIRNKIPSTKDIPYDIWLHIRKYTF